MRVLFERPPMFDEIDAKFHIADRGVIFAWGDIIYNPSRVEVSAALRAHEEVHGNRQAGDPETWWKRYIEDKAFRLAEEIPAHRAEYHRLTLLRCDRRARRSFLKQTAKRLADPLYGRLISINKATQALTARNA